jgi:radical SAM superfamily enzyme
MKYKITLKTWYQETPDKEYEEVLPNIFTSVENALEYLASNYEKVLDDYPVVGLSIG